MPLPRFTGRGVATIQGCFYLATGVWPLVHRRSFEHVTGPKADFWLAQTVGITVAAIGVGLVQAGSRRHVPAELRTVAVTSAVGLAAIDVYFVAQGRIRPIYLTDAAAELALVAGWLLARE